MAKITIIIIKLINFISYEEQQQYKQNEAFYVFLGV